MRTFALALPLLAAGSLALGSATGPDPGDPGQVAVQAGTVYLVEGGRVLTGGATVLIKDGRIQAVGSDLDVPAGAHVVDYGPDASIIPGLVTPAGGYTSSTFKSNTSMSRVAEPGLRAVDGFNFYSKNTSSLAAGVTTAYITPDTGRLISGGGALVKLTGEDRERRLLNGLAAVHGSIAADARDLPDYWEPPVPPTVDVGMGGSVRQLPRTVMGAVTALRELVGAAASGGDGLEEFYGPRAVPDLVPLLEKRLPWNVRADTQTEIRALLHFAVQHKLPLILNTGDEAGGLAEQIAQAGAKVIYSVPFNPNRSGTDRGKSPDDFWPDFTAASRLVAAGVPVAISGSGGGQRFAAALASRGGLDPGAALRAITLTPAEMFGGASRVGSLKPGKDADLVVLNGPPLAPTSSILATWADGALKWKAYERAVTVIEVDELHVGDGEVLRPGQILLEDGLIAEVGHRVSHPRGAAVVRGAAAMPGMIDALGYLGLEGSRRVPSTDFALAQIVSPGDELDRRVAQSGVTTVALSPRGSSSSGSPVMAYKPAAGDFDGLVVADPAALRFTWSDRNPSRVGASVRSVLEKAVKYHQDWQEYEEALAAWEPAKPAVERPKANLPRDEDDDDEDKDDDDDEKDEDEDEDEEDEDAVDPDPVTGVWTATIQRTESDEANAARLQLRNEGGELRGSLRSAAVSRSLLLVSGSYGDEQEVRFAGLGSLGPVEFEGEVKLPEKKKKKKRRKKDDDEEEQPDPVLLVGELSVGGLTYEVEFTRESREYLVAGRTERRRETGGDEEEDKSKPKEPKLDPRLEPLRRAIDGEAAVIVEVDREDQILDCVAAFEEAGIRPVLYGAEGVHHVADEIRGRVAGILAPSSILRGEIPFGLDTRNRLAEIQSAGIPVAFHSEAEEGAADLPLMAAYAVYQGMSPVGALRALTADAAEMLAVDGRVGRLEAGLDGDVLLLDGSPLDIDTRVLRVWVSGEEVH